MDSKVTHLHDKVSEALLGGGKTKIAKQHQKKKLTARERIEYLLDESSFEEIPGNQRKTLETSRFNHDGLLGR